MEISDFIGTKAQYDNDGQFIWGVEKEKGLHKIADLRGWGTIQNLFKLKGGTIDEAKAGKFQDDLGQWIADAINEKLERERKVMQNKNETIHAFYLLGGNRGVCGKPCGRGPGEERWTTQRDKITCQACLLKLEQLQNNI